MDEIEFFIPLASGVSTLLITRREWRPNEVLRYPNDPQDKHSICTPCRANHKTFLSLFALTEVRNAYFLAAETTVFSILTFLMNEIARAGIHFKALSRQPDRIYWSYPGSSVSLETTEHLNSSGEGILKSLFSQPLRVVARRRNSLWTAEWCGTIWISLEIMLVSHVTSNHATYRPFRICKTCSNTEKTQGRCLLFFVLNFIICHNHHASLMRPTGTHCFQRFCERLCICARYIRLVFFTKFCTRGRTNQHSITSEIASANVNKECSCSPGAWHSRVTGCRLQVSVL